MKNILFTFFMLTATMICKAQAPVGKPMKLGEEKQYSGTVMSGFMDHGSWDVTIKQADGTSLTLYISTTMGDENSIELESSLSDQLEDVEGSLKGKKVSGTCIASNGKFSDPRTGDLVNKIIWRPKTMELAK
jgi:hypothetical protein